MTNISYDYVWHLYNQVDITKQIPVIIMLGICSIEDLKSKKIHLIWPVSFAVFGIICWIFLWKQSMPEILITLFPGLSVLALSLITRGGIGQGDCLLLMTTGLFLGAGDTIQILIYAVFFSSIYALFLYIIKRKNKKYEMAFVPFLFLSLVINLVIEILNRIY